MQRKLIFFVSVSITVWLTSCFDWFEFEKTSKYVVHKQRNESKQIK